MHVILSETLKNIAFEWIMLNIKKEMIHLLHLLLTGHLTHEYI